MHEVNDLRNEWNWVRGKHLICIHWVVLHLNKHLLRYGYTCYCFNLSIKAYQRTNNASIWTLKKVFFNNFRWKTEYIYRNLIFNYSGTKRFYARSSINYNRHKRFTIPCRFRKECIFILLEATRLIILLAFVYMNSRPI